MFERGVGGVRSRRASDQDDPDAVAHGVLMQPNRLPHSPSDAISGDRWADPPGRDEPSAKSARAVHLQDAQDEQRATMRSALALHAQELGGARQSARLRKCQRAIVS